MRKREKSKREKKTSIVFFLPSSSSSSSFFTCNPAAQAKSAPPATNLSLSRMRKHREKIDWLVSFFLFLSFFRSFSFFLSLPLREIESVDRKKKSEILVKNSPSLLFFSFPNSRRSFFLSLAFDAPSLSLATQRNYSYVLFPRARNRDEARRHGGGDSVDVDVDSVAVAVIDGWY